MLELLIVLFIVSLGTYNAYILKCEKQEYDSTLYSKLEKSMGKFSLYAFISISFIIYIYTRSLILVLFVFSCFLFLYDGIINYAAKNKKFLAISNTLYFDRIIDLLYGVTNKNSCRALFIEEKVALFKLVLFVCSTLLLFK